MKKASNNGNVWCLQYKDNLQYIQHSTSYIPKLSVPCFPIQYTDWRLNISIKHYLHKMIWVQWIAEDERAKTSRTSSHLSPEWRLHQRRRQEQALSFDHNWVALVCWHTGHCTALPLHITSDNLKFSQTPAHKSTIKIKEPHHRSMPPSLLTCWWKITNYYLLPGVDHWFLSSPLRWRWQWWSYPTVDLVQSINTP